MAKDKKEKPVLNLDDKEYVIEDMTNSQRELANEVALYQNHVSDVQRKLGTNEFMRQLLAECEKVFVDKHQKGVRDLKKALEPEVQEVEAEA